MNFKKPIEAVPIEFGEQYCERRDATQAERDKAKQRAALKLALFGILAGAGIGLTAVSLRNGDLSWLRDVAPVSASNGQN